MSVSTTLHCDVPACTATLTTGEQIVRRWSATDLFEYVAARAGWSAHRVPYPFPGTTKTALLHRCPRHRKVLLRVERAGDRTYRIVRKTDQKADQ